MTTELMEPPTVTAKTAKWRYGNSNCVRCGQPISDGDDCEQWIDGPKSGSRFRWVHAGCTSQTMTVAEMERKLAEMIRQIAGTGGAGVDAQQLTAEVEAATAAINAETFNQLRAFGTAMGEACAAASEETLKMVQQIVADGVRKVITIQRLDGTHKEIGGHTHPVFEKVLKLAGCRKNIFLPGPAGCGKSHLAKQISEALDLPYGFISCTAGMSEGQLLGRLIPVGASGQFEYVASSFVTCYENGGVFLIDEVDAADSNTLLILNAALANGHMAVPNRPGKPIAVKHEDFICVAAANTFGRGADRQYVGRARLDESTMDRFRIGQVPMDYDETLEVALCPLTSLRGSLTLIREMAQAARLDRIVSTRFMKDAHDMVSCGAFTEAEAIEQLLQGWSKDEKSKVGR